MTTLSAIEAARNGDAHAIARMINKAMQSKGISVEGTKTDNNLTLTMQLNDLTQKDECVEFIVNGINKLKPNNISRLLICGRQEGSKIVRWREVFSINPTDKQVIRNQSITAKEPLAHSALKIDVSNRSIRAFGWVLFLLGIMLMFGGCASSTTVPSGDYGNESVHNIGKISEKSTLTNTGGFIAVCGAIFITCSKNKE